MITIKEEPSYDVFRLKILNRLPELGSGSHEMKFKTQWLKEQPKEPRAG